MKRSKMADCCSRVNVLVTIAGEERIICAQEARELYNDLKAIFEEEMVSLSDTVYYDEFVVGGCGSVPSTTSLPSCGEGVSNGFNYEGTGESIVDSKTSWPTNTPPHTNKEEADPLRKSLARKGII